MTGQQALAEYDYSSISVESQMHNKCIDLPSALNLDDIFFNHLWANELIKSCCLGHGSETEGDQPPFLLE